MICCCWHQFTSRTLGCCWFLGPMRRGSRAMRLCSSLRAVLRLVSGGASNNLKGPLRLIIHRNIFFLAVELHHCNKAMLSNLFEELSLEAHHGRNLMQIFLFTSLFYTSKWSRLMWAVRCLWLVITICLVNNDNYYNNDNNHHHGNNNIHPHDNDNNNNYYYNSINYNDNNCRQQYIGLAWIPKYINWNVITIIIMLSTVSLIHITYFIQIIFFLIITSLVKSE